MLEQHDFYLVALSIVIAILGGHTGFGLAARIRRSPNVSRRLLLAGGASFLAIGIWTMHFIGILAAPLPGSTDFLILPTIVSFLICALVVGISLYFVSVGEPSQQRIIASAILLGVGIASMHYVGMHGLAGPFTMLHSQALVGLSVLIAIGAGYGGLRAFLAPPDGIKLILSACAFGIAVSGMHYTAMLGVTFVPAKADALHHGDSIVASRQVLSLVVAVLCFVIASGFLLSLVPDPRRQLEASARYGEDRELSEAPVVVAAADLAPLATTGQSPPRPEAPPTPTLRQPTGPLGGLGQPPAPCVFRVPIESADGVYFLETTEIRSLKADAHYTRVHDGARERMCPWSISEAKSHLDPAQFIRVHRSHIVALAHVVQVRKDGDGAIVELDGPTPHRVPVSRARVAELKARLGLTKRTNHQPPR